MIPVGKPTIVTYLLMRPVGRGRKTRFEVTGDSLRPFALMAVGRGV